MKKQYGAAVMGTCLLAAALIAGRVFHRQRAGVPDARLQTQEVRAYEARFAQAVKLLSANTLVASDLADTVSKNWIKAVALGLDSTQQVERVFAQLQASGAQERLAGTHEELTAHMQVLKDCPFTQRTAFTVLENTYSVYTELYKLALHPAGSLVIFNKQVQGLEEELARDFNRLNLYTPKDAGARPRVAAAEKPVILARHDAAPSEQPGTFAGKTEAEIEQMLGSPVEEAPASAAGFTCKLYRHQGRDYTVYYKSAVVSGWTE